MAKSETKLWRAIENIDRDMLNERKNKRTTKLSLSLSPESETISKQLHVWVCVCVCPALINQSCYVKGLPQSQTF